MKRRKPRLFARALKSIGKTSSRAKIKGVRRNPEWKASKLTLGQFKRAFAGDWRVVLKYSPELATDPVAKAAHYRSYVAQLLNSKRITASTAKRALKGEASAVRSNPSRRDAIEKADALLESFSGSRANKELRAKVRPIHTGLVVGKLAGVMYEADRGDGKHNYFHRFKGSSRPLLISDHDGNQLGIVGGRYRFTDRGIVDD